MEIFDKDLYDRAFKNRNIDLDTLKITINGGNLGSFWFCSESSLDFYLAWNKLKNRNDALFLNLIHYFTYIPYGTVGYKTIEQYLKEKNINKTITQLRFEKLENVLQGELKNLPNNQIIYIKNFFNNYQKQIFDTQKIEDITCLICRVNGEIESNYGNSYFSDLIMTKKIIIDYCYKIANLGKEKKQLNINDVLYKFPKIEKLNQNQINHILKYFNLE